MLSEHKIHEIVCDILQVNQVSLKAVGNHELKRHLVYQVEQDGLCYIFKVYYRPNRRVREIASLRCLQKSGLPAPKIIDDGLLEDGTEWLLTECLDGIPLDFVLQDIEPDNRYQLFYEIGKLLGKMHAFTQLEAIGEWDETGHVLNPIEDYYQHYITKKEKQIKELVDEPLPDQELILQAIDYFNKNHHKLDISITPRLVHHDFDGRNILVDKMNQLYHITGIIDFERANPGNCEIDLVNLYYRYFRHNKKNEKAFINGYEQSIPVEENFYERLPVYLHSFAIGSIKWAYHHAPSYYQDQVQLLNQLING